MGDVYPARLEKTREEKLEPAKQNPLVQDFLKAVREQNAETKLAKFQELAHKKRGRPSSQIIYNEILDSAEEAGLSAADVEKPSRPGWPRPSPRRGLGQRSPAQGGQGAGPDQSLRRNGPEACPGSRQGRYRRNVDGNQGDHRGLLAAAARTPAKPTSPPRRPLAARAGRRTRR